MTCSDRLRVIHIITSLGRGGAETMLIKLLREMSKAPVTNEVIFLGGDTTLAADIVATGVPLTNLGIASLAGAMGSLLRIARIISKSKPDIVQSWLYHADLAATLAHGFARSQSA